MLLRVACVLALLAGLHVLAVSGDSRAQELQELTAASHDGVVSLSTAQFQNYALTAGRSYSLIVFLTAASVVSNPQTKIADLRAEFGYASKAFASVPDNDRVFFTELSFDRSPEIFASLGVNQLPFVFHWSPKQRQKASGKIDLSEEDKVGKRATKFPWPAEYIAEFVTQRTKQGHGPIERPNFLKHPLFPVFAVALLVAAGYTAYRVMYSPIFRSPYVWMFGFLVVYWFSTSGGMFNIIRGMPMYTIDQKGKMRWFMQGGQGQFGLEGFFMGGLYIVFSMCLCVITYVAPWLQSDYMRRTVATTAMMAGAYTVLQVSSLYQAKTGYRLNVYF